MNFRWQTLLDPAVRCSHISFEIRQAPDNIYLPLWINHCKSRRKYLLLHLGFLDVPFNIDIVQILSVITQLVAETTQNHNKITASNHKTTVGNHGCKNSNGNAAHKSTGQIVHLVHKVTILLFGIFYLNPVTELLRNTKGTMNSFLRDRKLLP